MLGDEAGILMSDDGDEAGILMSDDANIDSDSSSALIGSEGSSGPPEDSMILQLEAEPEAGSDGVVEAGASSDDEPLLGGASEQLGAGGWQPGHADFGGRGTATATLQSRYRMDYTCSRVYLEQSVPNLEGFGVGFSTIASRRSN
jgi:hypothetical protein